MSDNTEKLTSQHPDEASDKALRSQANKALVRYGLARLGLFILLTIIIQVAAVLIGAPVPLVMSALLALIVAFPLSMLVFPKMRMEANAAVAAWNQRRKDRKEWIAQELSER